jgi:hypothetical protein
MATLAVLREVPTGQYLRKPDVLTNVPFLVTTGIADNTMILGDFSKLIIGIRTQLRIEVLRELYGESPVWLQRTPAGRCWLGASAVVCQGHGPDSELNDLPVEPRQESLRCFFVLMAPLWRVVARAVTRRAALIAMDRADE